MPKTCQFLWYIRFICQYTHCSNPLLPPPSSKERKYTVFIYVPRTLQILKFCFKQLLCLVNYYFSCFKCMKKNICNLSKAVKCGSAPFIKICVKRNPMQWHLQVQFYEIWFKLFLLIIDQLVLKDSIVTIKLILSAMFLTSKTKDSSIPQTHKNSQNRVHASYLVEQKVQF